MDWVGRHVGLGLAPRPFGVGAGPVWDRRDHAIKAVLDLPILQALFVVRRLLTAARSVSI